MIRYRDIRACLLPGLVLGIGAGAITAAVGLLGYLAYDQPASVTAPERVVSVPAISSYRRYTELRDTLTQLHLAGFKRASADFEGQHVARPIVLECGTPDYFDVLGVRASIGRTWRRTSDGSASVALLSGSFWKSALGADRTSLGAVIRLNGTSYEVIGVTPDEYTGLRAEPADVFVPVEANPEVCLHRGRTLLDEGHWLNAFGRLVGQASYLSAASELGISGDFSDSLTSLPQARWLTVRRDIQAASVSSAASAILMLLALCNVLGLQALYGVSRRTEVAIRLQLGASRRHLFATFLSRQWPLLLWSALGALASYSAMLWFARDDFPGSVLNVARGPAVRFTFVTVIIGASVLAAAVVAWGTASLRIDSTLSRHTGARTWISGAMLVVQVATAFALIVGSFLTGKSSARLISGAGLDVEHLVLVSGSPLAQGYRSPQDVSELFRLLRQRLADISGVSSASVSTADLLGALKSSDVAYLRSSTDRAARHGIGILSGVSPDYLQTVRTELARGQWWSPAAAVGEPVIVVSENLARELWADDDPIGKCAFFLRAARCIRVVGTVKSRRAHNLTQQDSEVFIPLEQAPSLRPDVLPRTVIVRLADMSAVDAVRRVSKDLPSILSFPPMDVRTVESLAEGQSRAFRFSAWTLGAMGIVGISLGLLGIVASVAFAVSTRRREFGIRSALGASPFALWRAVVAPSLRSAAAGLALGILLLGWSRGLLTHVLFEIPALDLMTLAEAGVVVVLAVTVSASVPASGTVRSGQAQSLRE